MTDIAPQTMGSPERIKNSFPQKALMCSLAHSQNKGLSKYQKRASRLHIGLSPVQRQRDRQATARARRHVAAAILAPEMASSSKL